MYSDDTRPFPSPHRLIRKETVGYARLGVSLIEIEQWIRRSWLKLFGSTDAYGTCLNQHTKIGRRREMHGRKYSKQGKL